MAIMMDRRHYRTYKEKYGLIIGQTTAERLKIEIGSLYSNDWGNQSLREWIQNSKTPSYTIVTPKT